MKKVFSLATIALFALTVLFTACRDNAGQGSESQTPAQTEQNTAPADTPANTAQDTTQVAQ